MAALKPTDGVKSDNPAIQQSSNRRAGLNRHNLLRSTIPACRLVVGDPFDVQAVLSHP
jgi:hypothetical protein